MVLRSPASAPAPTSCNYGPAPSPGMQLQRETMHPINRLSQLVLEPTKRKKKKKSACSGREKVGRNLLFHQFGLYDY